MGLQPLLIVVLCVGGLTNLANCAYLGESCTNDGQCRANVPNSACDANKCVCAPGFVALPGENYKCYPGAGNVGDDCVDDSACKGIPGSICKDNGGVKTCECDDVTHVHDTVNNKCLAKTQLGGQCEQDIQCQVDNCECAGQTCACEAGAVPTGDGRCLKATTPIGGDCTTDSDCVGVPGVTSVCASTKKCACMEGYVANVAKDNCLIIRFEVNQTCEEAPQCTAGPLGNSTDCVEGHCQCEEGYAIVDKKCVKATGLGEVCHTDEECKVVNEHSECAVNEETKDFRCKCVSAAVEMPDKTCHMRRVGDECTTTADCTAAIAGDVECLECDKICWCMDGFISGANMSSCDPVTTCATTTIPTTTTTPTTTQPPFLLTL